jgi:hypothetical protein
VVEAEGENHFLGDAILLFPSRRAPVSVGAEAFVEVAAVVVDEEVAAVDDLFGDEEGGALGLRAVGFARALMSFSMAMMEVYSVPWAPETSARILPGFAPLMTTTGMLVAGSTPAGTSR